MVLPRPILSLTVAPVDPGERGHLHAVLAALSAADRAISFVVDPASGMTRLRGESLEQLLAACRCIERERHIPIEFSLPEVILVEMLRQPAEGVGKYIRQTGGSGNYGHVKLRLEPQEPGAGIAFTQQIRGGVVPEKYLQPIEQGIREAARGGILAGCEVVDFKATLYDGSHHEMDSNPMAFRIAASLAFKDAARMANPAVMEPVMRVAFTVPESRLGAKIAEINRLRGRIEEASGDDASAVIRAAIPLHEMLRYSGPVPHSMEFSHYEPARWPPDDAETASSAVRNPRGPGPRGTSAKADPDLDWT